jgi:hypothetical protein
MYTATTAAATTAAAAAAIMSAYAICVVIILGEGQSVEVVVPVIQFLLFRLSEISKQFIEVTHVQYP